MVEVAQDPLRVEVTHRPTQSNPKLQPHHLTVPPHTHGFAQPGRFRLLNGARTGVAYGGHAGSADPNQRHDLRR